MVDDKRASLPILTTHSLVLRKLTQNDAEAIYRIRSDKKVAEFLVRPICKSIDEAKEFIQ